MSAVEIFQIFIASLFTCTPFTPKLSVLVRVAGVWATHKSEFNTIWQLWKQICFDDKLGHDVTFYVWYVACVCGCAAAMFNIHFMANTFHTHNLILLQYLILDFHWFPCKYILGNNRLKGIKFNKKVIPVIGKCPCCVPRGAYICLLISCSLCSHYLSESRSEATKSFSLPYSFMLSTVFLCYVKTKRSRGKDSLLMGSCTNRCRSALFKAKNTKTARFAQG